jgi:hypothetical protein
MRIWFIRGRYDRQSLVDKTSYWERYGEEYDEKYTDGQWLYWTRHSTWDKKEVASIQVNMPSATRAFKRAQDHLSRGVMEAELLGMDIKLPDGE